MALISSHGQIYYYSLLLLVLFFSLFNINNTNAQRLNQTNVIFFFQDFGSGPNATVVPITGITGKSWSFSTFGTIFAIDDLITETPEIKSTKLGRAQGVLVVSSLDGSNVNVFISIVFNSNNAQLSGSSLELQGVIRQSETFREVSVVSGTGRFRFARGYAIFDTIYYDRLTSYTIIRCTCVIIT